MEPQKQVTISPIQYLATELTAIEVALIKHGSFYRIALFGTSLGGCNKRWPDCTG